MGRWGRCAEAQGGGAGPLGVKPGARVAQHGPRGRPLVLQSRPLERVVLLEGPRPVARGLHREAA